ncbi:LRR receptor-like serine/threonine-protein kinase EFR isoform X1 [Salvia miltiorrhiza]|uniref:LRR receptor-like serine/threonine-protein kinase EFR isoform X1 n=1 Tax=Salvia miltiorrhiza TaxID=226208 RepID=UPI0025AC8A86|nr:LRR receptor-like serine/threonine-protein kinase EFR isoform X1 [Salvia miltiorrhiza]XP_057797613.1 LRR receptor-like serine/threonine-protein kinase EFR isoform X1 [Salvia miltiorrhiza]
MDKTFAHLFAFAVFLLSYSSPKSFTTANLATDQSSLLSLKTHIISDTYLTNWSNSSSVCSWIGVTCSTRHRRVAALNISDMGLSGNIPPQLGNLSFLVSLDLASNNFSGTLPQELSRLRRLKIMSLSVNNFVGEIPSWLPLLPKLEFISLRGNSFTGSIPKSISNLTNLYHLDFSSNSLDGKIPQELGELQRLQHLVIQSNHLSGIIPSALFNMSSLRRLAFRSNELSGNLPNDLCANLPVIQEIYLGINQLSGQIPSNLSRCSQLGLLSLASNSFSGQIPAAVGDLKSIRILQLSRNHLSGTVPLNIFNISSLRSLYLSSNKLYGNLSRDIGNLTMLTDLFLSENNFTGLIPPEIGHRLYHLETLALGVNMFIGSIPPEIFNISTLRVVELTRNDLSGALPTNLCSGFPFLQELYLGDNHFSGPIPESISNCSQLTHLDLGANKFTGLLPHSLGTLTFLQKLSLIDNNLTSSSSHLSFITSLTNCRSLSFLAIDDNPLGATLPSSIANLSSHLQTFSAFNCRLKGGIPAEIGNLTSLVELSLHSNDLSGNIPLTVKHLLNLQSLNVRNNSITGIIPHDLCDLHSLSELRLSGNQLSGEIPNCLGNVTSLRYLLLSSNKLTSTIPSGLWSLKDLLRLNLSSNSLIGSLPMEVGNLAASIYIDLSMNQLSKSIPSTVGNLQNLVSLSLEHNRLEGSIPVSIGSMISLETLDLSYNNLSGSVPKSLQALTHLNNFNVSFNALSGEIPSGGPFMNFTMESFKGNEALCGIPRFDVPTCNVVNKHKSKKVEFALFILVGVVAFTTILCLGFIFIRFKMKDRAKSETIEILSVVPGRISYYELSQATQQFNESNLLGTGSFGSVYKGILGNGNGIAVKVFNLQSEAAFRSFDVECEVLRNIRHRNLTKVISTCSNEEFKALVLEYMPKGNLEKWLYSHNYILDFIQRLNIMIDVAMALEYLHHGYFTPIVHCDLKPSNVLLDEEMIAHVSDFGVSKLLGEGESVVLTKTLATLGYIAPEYGFEGLVSTKCDVYSYGVMLMEIFTRKKPSDDMFAGDLSLKIWIESSVLQSTYRVIDDNLLMNVDEEHGDKIVEFTSSILELALKCSTDSPKERINMKEALAEMLKIKRQFLE